MANNSARLSDQVFKSFHPPSSSYSDSIRFYRGTFVRPYRRHRLPQSAGSRLDPFYTEVRYLASAKGCSQGSYLRAQKRRRWLSLDVLEEGRDVGMALSQAQEALEAEP
jgi:hypothetical protein